MPFFRTVSFMVFLPIFLTGCAKGCSGTQSGTTAGSAVQPASKPTVFFRIVPSGAECVSGQTCQDSDIQLLGDLSRDLAQPIDWTKENVDWQVNHDFESNLKKAQEENKLSVSCDTARIKSLYRTRQKLFYILHKEGVMDAVKDLLEWGVAAVPAAQDNAADFTWSKSASVVSNERR